MLPDSMYDYRHEYPEAIEVDRCSWCGCSIYTEDIYHDFKGTVICNDCLPDYLYKYQKIGGED